MPNERQLVFTEEFLAAVKRLRKRYRHIEDDLRPLLEQVRKGEAPGDQIQGAVFAGVSYKIYKERLPNRDAQRGKSGGYRVIYYLQSNEVTVMVTIYSKSDQTDIRLDEIESILADILAKPASDIPTSSSDSSLE
jgi:mRNA-degrading endonuclease RelE of RelBE toxin-antitoxin system